MNRTDFINLNPGDENGVDKRIKEEGGKHFAFLPLGSVVEVKDYPRRLMIIGRAQKEVRSGLLYEYCAVPWPEGLLSASRSYLFDGGAIEQIIFVGLQDEQEIRFRQEIEKAWVELLDKCPHPLAPEGAMMAGA